MATYRKADDYVQEMVEDLVAKYHTGLAEHEVRIQVMYAHARRHPETGEPIGPAIRHHGYQAAGLAKINSHKDRAEGKQDATITVDGDRWEDWSEAEKLALLDHELHHFEVAKDKDGAVLLDDCNRPRLKMRLHDMQLGGFSVIAERHGPIALEVQVAKQIANDYGQLLFGWMAKDELAEAV